MRADFVTGAVCTDSTWIEDMGRQESPQLIERKTQVDTDAQETSRASNFHTSRINKNSNHLFFT